MPETVTSELRNEVQLLQASDVCVHRSGRDILKDAGLVLNPGEFTVAVGSNGAGKSTLLKCLSGELKPDAGTVCIKEREISKWNNQALARYRAVLPQHAPLEFPFLVEEVVAMGRLPHQVNSDQATDQAAVERALEQVDLLHLIGRRYTTLSGGERQLTQLARVLAQLDLPLAHTDHDTNCILLLDEPTGALDIRHQHRILSIVRAYSRQNNAVFAVLHDLNYALQFADRILLLKDGRICYDLAAADCESHILEEIFGITLTEFRGGEGQIKSLFFPCHPSFATDPGQPDFQ